MGDMGNWLAENWFNLFTVFFGSGLWFAAFSIRQDARIRKDEVAAKRVANLLAITANHREVWGKFLDNPSLGRVFDATADVIAQPVTDMERVFVTLVIGHTTSVYYAMTKQLVVEYDALQRDIAHFFALPIPQSVWKTNRQFQNHEFIAFVEAAGESSCRTTKV